MEKIKQALEKAKLHRSNLGSKTASDTTTNSAAKDARQKVTYKETRKIEISVEYLRDNCIYAGNENNTITDAYKVLRTRVLQAMRKQKWNTLAVTSPTSGNGKTVTAINLAISISKEVNQTVLLVDLDLRQPSIRKYFSEQEMLGLSDYLETDVDVSDILFNPSIERLVIMPGNKSYINSSEMLSSPKMLGLVNELKNRYKDRIIIFDLPPILSCDDVLAFLPYVDSLLLVLEDGKNSKEDVSRAFQLLDHSKFIGTVLNKSFEDASNYSYS